MNETAMMLKQAGITDKDLEEYTNEVYPSEPFDRERTQRIINKISEWKKKRGK